MADHEEKYSGLLDWYSRLSTRRVDLVGDYAGQELFIVEGDGLLLRCFDDPGLDFYGTPLCQGLLSSVTSFPLAFRH